MIARVLVGCTTVRPVQPDQEFRVVLVAGETETECQLVAAQMVVSHDNVEMPTSTEILDLLEIQG
jgi:hypothetical protein